MVGEFKRKLEHDNKNIDELGNEINEMKYNNNEINKYFEKLTK
jgi:hypothetical protein